MKFALIVLSVLILTFTIVMLDTWAVNQVLSLDGSRDYVEVPPSDSLDITGAVTLGGWVFHKDAETPDWSQAWLSKYEHRLLSWNIRSDGFFIAQDEMWDEEMLRYGAPKDEWFHIACVYDSQKQQVYLNGELAAERDCPVSSVQATHRLKLERSIPNIGPVCLMKSVSGTAHAPTKKSDQR